MTATIRTEGLTKQYGHAIVLDSLNLEVEQGEVFGYLGPNGAGKSTTIALLLALIRATSGTAYIFDMDVWHEARAVHQHVAYVPSEANLWPSLTGAESCGSSATCTGSSIWRIATSSSSASTWFPTRRSAPTATATGRRCC